MLNMGHAAGTARPSLPVGTAVTFLLVVVLGGWAAYTWDRAASIHRYYVHDSDVGFATWSYHFGSLEILALVLSGCSLAGVRLTRRGFFAGAASSARRTSVVVPVMFLALNVCVLVGIHRSAGLWNGGPSGDPSGWMRAASLCLALEVVGCVGVAIWLLRKSRSKDVRRI